MKVIIDELREKLDYYYRQREKKGNYTIEEDAMVEFLKLLNYDEFVKDDTNNFKKIMRSEFVDKLLK